MRDVLTKYVSARGGLADCEGLARVIKVIKWIERRERRGVLRVVR